MILTLEVFDQQKLADFLLRAPREIVVREVGPSSGGTLVTDVFPRQAGPVSINCKSHFYDRSPYPSDSLCKFTVDVTDSRLEHSYDDYRLKITDRETVTALSSTLLYGLDVKEMYSFGRDVGRNFDGTYGNVFHYHFQCSKEECFIEFSSKALKD